MACESVLRDRSLVAGEPLLIEHFDLRPTLHAPHEARHLVADALAGANAPSRAATAIDTAQLLISELVTNAVMHARTELHVGVCCDADTMLCTIADGHPDLPPDKRPPMAPDQIVTEFEESGRGMSIIVALATDFGWRLREHGAGKVMWFTLDLTHA